MSDNSYKNNFSRLGHKNEAGETVYDLAKAIPAMLSILNAHNPAASDPAETTSEKLESITAPQAAKHLSNGTVKTRKSEKGDDPVSVTETDSEEEETATHGEKQESKLDEGSDISAAVTSTREVLRFTFVWVLFYSNWSLC
jgi:hypothetical protein